MSPPVGCGGDGKGRVHRDARTRAQVPVRDVQPCDSGTTACACQRGRATRAGTASEWPRGQKDRRAGGKAGVRAGRQACG
jgi:hypothetical protein